MTHLEEENNKEQGMVYGKAKCYDTAIVYNCSVNIPTTIEDRLHMIENEQRMAFLDRIFR